MDIFCITKTPIGYDDNVRIVLLKESGSYRGRPFQGFVSNNENFKMIGLPFKGKYVDKARLSVDETDQNFKFTFQELKSNIDDQELNWNDAQELMLRGRLFIKENFINFMVIHEDIYQLLLKEKVESHSTLYQGAELSVFRNYFEKELSFFKTSTLPKNLKKLSSENSVQDELKDLNLRSLVMNLDNPTLELKFKVNQKPYLDLFKFGGFDYMVDQCSKLFFINEVLDKNGYFFEPTRVCDETFDCSLAAEFSSKVSAIQEKIYQEQDEDSFILEIKTDKEFILKKSIFLKTITEWGYSQSEIDDLIMELSVYSLGRNSFKIDINPKSEIPLIAFISKSVPNSTKVITVSMIE
jgi:hypothetical protein